MVSVIKSCVLVLLEMDQGPIINRQTVLSLVSVQRHLRLGKDGRHRQVRASLHPHHHIR